MPLPLLLSPAVVLVPLLDGIGTPLASLSRRRSNTLLLWLIMLAPGGVGADGLFGRANGWGTGEKFVRANLLLLP